MPIFVYVYEDYLEVAVDRTRTQTTKELNRILDSLQRKGATILDVKVSSAMIIDNTLRTYLIIYKAMKPTEP